MGLMPDAVIFDMDGLLIDTERFSLRAFEYAVASHNLDGLTDIFTSLVGTNDKHHKDTLKSELGHLVDPVAFRQTWVDHFHELTHSDTIPLLDGVPETLQWLREQGVKTAVATSSGSQAAEQKLTDTGIRDYFATVTCGDHVTNSKPDPEIYLKAGKSIGADMSRSIGLEDSANGVKSAHAAGLNVIQIPNIVPSSQELLALGVRVCDSMYDVLKLMQSGQALPPQR